jgi:hypothetical protein
VLDAERLAIDTAITRPRALNEPVGRTPLVLDDDLAAAELLAELRQPDQRRRDLAEG